MARAIPFISLLLLSIAGWQPSAGRQVELSILHTTDVHGHIWPTTDYEGQGDVGGFLRCAARIEELRAAHPNTLLIDCGDTFQGAPESWLNEGRLLIDGLNHLRYDAWVLGNHEIDWGVEVLRRRHDQAEMPFLAANLYFRDPAANWLPKIRPFIIKEVDGIRVALIGLTTPGIPRWSRPYLLDGALFRQSVESLTELMPLVKEAKPDVIVLAVHQGFKNRGDDFANQIQALARQFPEVDVMLGGHSHVPVEDMRFGPVLYSQAGYHGIWVGQVTLTYDTIQRAVVSKQGRLDRMDASVPYHEGLLTRWKEELDRAGESLSRPAGVLAEVLDPKPDARGQSSMQQFICRAIAAGVDVEFVLHGSLAEERLEPGPLRERDLWKIVPYENDIGVVMWTPQQIAAALEENFTRPVTHQSLGAYGFTFRAVGEGRHIRVVDLRDMQGQSLHARKRYRVALNSYVLASGGERYNRIREMAEEPESRLDMTGKDTRSLVRQYLAGPPAAK